MAIWLEKEPGISKANSLKFGFCFTVLSLFTSLSLAQIDSMTHRMESMSSEISQGIQTSRVATIYGTVSVITPAFVESGDRISGTVLVNPKGESEIIRKKNGEILRGMSIQVLGTKVASALPMFTVVVPTGQPTVTIDDSEIGVSVFAPNTCPAEADRPGFALTNIGRAPLSIPGMFDGDASNTTCSIGGQPAIILAESPRQVVVWTPPSLTGPQVVQVEESGTSMNGKVNLIGLSLSVPKTNLMKGERTTLTAKVSGLEGLTSDQYPIKLSLANESPNNVSLGSGSTIETTLWQSDISALGEYRMTSTITAIAPGSFSVSGQVVSAQFGAGSWWNDDQDHPIDMSGIETIGDLRGYSIRQLMDTLRDLRYRKMWDYVRGQKSQDWLAQKIKLVKAALHQHGVAVVSKNIDN
jgi:hypothetical protein